MAERSVGFFSLTGGGLLFEWVSCLSLMCIAACCKYLVCCHRVSNASGGGRLRRGFCTVRDGTGDTACASALTATPGASN